MGKHYSQSFGKLFMKAFFTSDKNASSTPAPSDTFVNTNEAPICSATRIALSPTNTARALSTRFEESLERFSKPNIRFGSGRTGSKIVSKFRLTHNRKLRSANRNTIDHTIVCPALLLWCLAVESRGPCVPKKCSLSNCASPGDSFCQVLDHW